MAISFICLETLLHSLVYEFNSLPAHTFMREISCFLTADSSLPFAASSPHSLLPSRCRCSLLLPVHHSGTAFPRSIAYVFFRWNSISFAQMEFVSWSIYNMAEMQNPSFNSALLEWSLKGVRARQSQRHAAHTKARIRKHIWSIEPIGSFSNIPQDVARVLSLSFHSHKPIFTH